MIDIQLIRDNPELVKERSAQKNVEVDIDRLLEVDKDRKSLVQTVEALRAKRNENAEVIKQAGGKPDQALIDAGKQIKIQLAEQEEYLRQTETEWLSLLKQVPNMPSDDVPVGSSEEENVVAKQVGKPREFNFSVKSDEEIGLSNDLIDKERAAKVAGARFTYLKGDLVRVQFALIQFVMKTLSDQGIIEKLIRDNNLNLSSKSFVPILPPPMVRTDVYDATARLNGAEVTYKLEDDDLWMNASAEHSLAPMYAGEILDEKQLPIRYIGYATSFRREAGTYGKDVEGIFRLHHFDKLEMVTFSTSETSTDEHLLMVAIQEYLVGKLELPYRVINKCTADIGKPNARGVDIDVWMPHQKKYRETHTADLITDYQARRVQTRVRRASGVIELVHNNDGTAFALSRILKAIMENYQLPDGSFDIPAVLKPYM